MGAMLFASLKAAMTTEMSGTGVAFAIVIRYSRLLAAQAPRGKRYSTWPMFP